MLDVISSIRGAAVAGGVFDEGGSTWFSDPLHDQGNSAAVLTHRVTPGGELHGADGLGVGVSESEQDRRGHKTGFGSDC